MLLIERKKRKKAVSVSKIDSFSTVNNLPSVFEAGNYLVINISKGVSIVSRFFTFVSKDVLHSWYVPNIGVKMDCVPGQYNNISTHL